MKKRKADFEQIFIDEKGHFLKPETGIGIICVCDRLLTGFDAPVEQVMYLDKIVKAHNLLQAIARVNRIGGESKDKGFIPQ